ncbi:Replication factor C subunit 5, partial [Trichinella murrelli]
LINVVQKYFLVGRFINENRLPHLLFYGPPGTGKTSTILACAKQLYEKNQLKSMVLELNASDDRGIGVVREQILNFASTKTIFGGRFKMIILDEADAMTRDAQNALLIEKYTDNVRFCLICNYLSKIIPPLQSRCTRFRFAPLKSNQITPRLMHVIEAEKVKFTEEGLQHLVLLSGGDMRRALNILQSTAMAFDMVNMENVYACVGKPKPDDIRAIVEWLFNKDFSETYKRITFLKLKKGLALQDILEEVHLFVQKVEIPALVRIYLIDRLAEIEESLTRGASDKLQLSALIAAFHIARDIIEKEAIVTGGCKHAPNKVAMDPILPSRSVGINMPTATDPYNEEEVLFPVSSSDASRFLTSHPHVFALHLACQTFL